MASWTKAHRRRQKLVAFATALTLHVLFLALLTAVRTGLPPPVFNPELEPPGPAVEVSLVPGSGEPGATGQGGAPAQARAARPSSAAAEAAGLRGAASASPAAAPQPSPAAPPSIAPPPTPAPTEPALKGPVEPSPAQVVPSPRPPELEMRRLESPSRPTPKTALEAARPLTTPPPAPSLEAAPPLLSTVRPTVQTYAITPAARLPAARPLQAARGVTVAPPAPSLEAAPPILATTRPNLETFSVEPSARPQAQRPLQAARGVTVAPPAPSLEAAPPILAAGPASVQAPPSPSLSPAGRPTAPLRGLEGPRALALSPPDTAGQAGEPGAAPAGQADAGSPAGAAPGRPAPGQGAAVAGGPGGPAAGAHPGCAPEDLVLLTPAERERCRNQIDAQNARRAAAQAERDAARRLAIARGQRGFSGISPDKRAYYDAVLAARAAVKSTGEGGKPPGLACNLGALFGGPSGLPAEKIKIPGVPCVFIPPTGVLTEETRLTPP